MACRTETEVHLSPAAEVLRGDVLAYLDLSCQQPDAGRLLVPDGVAKIALTIHGELHVMDQAAATTSGALIQGLRTVPAKTRHHGRLHTVVVLLSPLGAYRILGVPNRQWSQGTYMLSEFAGLTSAGVAERLAECTTWQARVHMLDRLLAARVSNGGPTVSPEVAWAWQRLTRSGGRTRVEALCAETGWSRRRLQRRFGEQVGLPPKAAAGVLRLQRALRLYRSGTPIADSASSAGYYDQAHFIRTCREMLGHAPSKMDGAGIDTRDRLAELIPGRLSTIPAR